MPKTTKGSVLADLTTRYDSELSSRVLFYRDVAVGNVIWHGARKAGGRTGTVYAVSGLVEGVRFREEAGSAKAAMAKAAAALARGLNALPERASGEAEPEGECVEETAAPAP